MENQSLAGHVAPRRIGHPRRRGRGSGQHVLAGRARIDQLLSGSAPALGADHHVAAGCHAIDLPLPGLVRVPLPGRHKAAAPPGLRLRSRCRSLQPPLPARRQPSPPCALRRSSPARLPRTRITDGPPDSAADVDPFAASLAAGRIRARRTQQHHPHRLAGPYCARPASSGRRSITITGAGNRVGLLPQPRVSAEGGFVGRAVQFGLLRNHVRRTLPAQGDMLSRAAAPAARPRACRSCRIQPGRLHVSVRKGIAGFLLKHPSCPPSVASRRLPRADSPSGAATPPRPHTRRGPPSRASAAAAAPQASPPACSTSTTCPSSTAD